MRYERNLDPIYRFLPTDLANLREGQIISIGGADYWVRNVIQNRQINLRDAQRISYTLTLFPQMRCVGNPDVIVMRLKESDRHLVNEFWPDPVVLGYKDGSFFRLGKD